jgi:hypothetical protein
MRPCPRFGRRVLASYVSALCLFAAPALAQQIPDPPPATLRTASAVPLELVPVQLPARRHETSEKRPAALIPLYVAFAGLQGLDIHSTRRGIDSGATRESNPVVKPFVGSDVAFIALKVSATAGTILFTERVRKKRPKTAVALAVAFNAGMALVVAHNYRVSR